MQKEAQEAVLEQEMQERQQGLDGGSSGDFL